ncbi:MAG: hypothetical protein QY322_03330 [bacterium]|nr:MAG: hypothetical protein QY322_03330 [bacterium]
MEKISETIRIAVKQTFSSLLEKIKPKLIAIDQKITTFLPNPKVKMLVYITLGSMVGFMFLIIILGLLLSPLRRVDTNTGTVLNKPNIIVESPKPQVELTENQEQILILGNEVKDLSFPPNILNIPVIQSDLNYD